MVGWSLNENSPKNESEAAITRSKLELVVQTNANDMERSLSVTNAEILFPLRIIRIELKLAQSSVKIFGFQSDIVGDCIF